MARPALALVAQDSPSQLEVELAAAAKALEAALASMERYLIDDICAPPFSIEGWRRNLVEACKAIDQVRSS